jgi:hypothetical protein
VESDSSGRPFFYGWGNANSISKITEVLYYMNHADTCNIRPEAIRELARAYYWFNLEELYIRKYNFIKWKTDKQEMKDAVNSQSYELPT